MAQEKKDQGGIRTLDTTYALQWRKENTLTVRPTWSWSSQALILSNYGHTQVKPPHPVRSAQLNTWWQSQYYGGGPHGNTLCCNFFIFFDFFFFFRVLTGGCLYALYVRSNHKVLRGLAQSCWQSTLSSRKKKHMQGFFFPPPLQCWRQSETLSGVWSASKKSLLHWLKGCGQPIIYTLYHSALLVTTGLRGCESRHVIS